MNTTDGIWVPSYYRRRRRFSWARAAGGPRVADWVAGVVLAVLMLGLVALVRAPQRQGASSDSVVAGTTAAPAPTAPAPVTTATDATTVATANDSDMKADRVAYVPRTSH